MTGMSGAVPRQIGFTLIEVAIVIFIVAILAALLTPYVANQIEEARITRAQSDTQNIGQAISNMNGDLGRYPMFGPSSGITQPQFPDSGANVDTLIGPGNPPTDSSSTPWTTGTTCWTSTCSSGSETDCTASCSTDTIVNQLVGNTPVYPTTSSLSKPFMWKGPYIDPQPDPWGNAYVVNIIHCKVGSSYGCFVLSAGPNGHIDTNFDIRSNTSITATGDDILYRIR